MTPKTELPTSIQRLKQRYSKGFKHVWKNRTPPWRSKLIQSDDLPKKEGLIPGLPYGVYMCDLLKKVRQASFPTVYQCVGYLNKRGFRYHVDEWVNFEQGITLPSEEEIMLISEIFLLPVEEMKLLRNIQHTSLEHNRIQPKLAQIIEEGKNWEREVCGLIASSSLFLEPNLCHFSSIRNTLIFSAGIFNFRNSKKRGMKQFVTLDSLWYFWERSLWNSQQTIEDVQEVPDKKQKSKQRSSLPVILSYQIDVSGHIEQTIIANKDLEIKKCFQSISLEHWSKPLQLSYVPEHTPLSAIPHTLTSMIQYIKDHLWDFDFENLSYKDDYESTEWKLILEALQFQSHHILYIHNKDEVVCDVCPNIEIQPNHDIFLNWSRDKSIFIKNYEIQPFFVKQKGEVLLACNRPLPLDWWLFYIQQELE